jgi:hypothetical protein
MRVTANIATYPARFSQLLNTLESIRGQFDEVRICCNEYDFIPKELEQYTSFIPERNLTDNGKFYYLDVISEHEYYFTLDDDIIYPPDYVTKMVAFIDKYGVIATLHGRILLDLNVNYYRGHKFFHCKSENQHPIRLDVCGTGVTAFSTKNFHPYRLAKHEYQKMSDIIFSHAAAMSNKKIGLIPKPDNWVIPQYVEDSIFNSEVNTKQEYQIKLCNEIWKIKKLKSILT